MKIFNFALVGSALSQSAISSNRPGGSTISITGDENPDELMDILVSVSGKL